MVKPKEQTSMQIATWNLQGYGTHELDAEAEGGDLARTATRGKHACLQQFHYL